MLSVSTEFLNYETIKLLVYPIAHKEQIPAFVCRARDRRCFAADFHHLDSHNRVAGK